MKTLSGRFRFVVIGVIAMVAVVSCCYFPSIGGTKSYAAVEIGDELPGKIPRYVEWKDEGAKFKQALEQVRGHNGEYCLCVLEKPGAKPHRYPDSKCPGRYDCPPENIRTVKVTKSKAAGNIAAGEPAVDDPHVTYRVQSPDPRDIIKVLGALK
jgi:hypothetical protein